eukprot:6288504-Prorocentrum_lima.AAC.1
MPAAYRTCMECTPSLRKHGWVTCRACGETVPSAACAGDRHCPHCTVDKSAGRKRCSKCGARRPASECHGSGSYT